MKKDNKRLLLAILIGLVIILFIYFVNIGSRTQNTNQNNEVKTKTISLSKDNFIYIPKEGKSLNSGTLSMNCDKINAGDCSFIHLTSEEKVETCWYDTYTIKYKLSNLPQEITENNEYGIFNNIKCRVYSNGDLLGWKTYDINGVYTETQYDLTFSYSGDDKTSVMLMMPIDIRQNNNLMVCCKVNGTYYHSQETGKYGSQQQERMILSSNEVCLDSVNVPAVC
jgi:hypothetical protein